MQFSFSIFPATVKSGRESFSFQAEIESSASKRGDEDSKSSYCRLTVTENDNNEFQVDLRFPVAYSTEDQADGSDSLIGMETPMHAHPSEAQEELNQYISKKSYGLIRVDMDSFLRVLEQGPDKAGEPYFFTSYELREFGSESVVLVPDFTNRLFLVLKGSSAGDCYAVPYMLAF